MTIEKVHISPTDITPEVILDPEGIITIKGRSSALNIVNVPTQIKSWIDAYINYPAESTVVNIAFEYLNSDGTTILASILRDISKVILQDKKLVIHWYYEEDDEDMSERGEYISEALNIPFEFIMTNSSRDH